MPADDTLSDSANASPAPTRPSGPRVPTLCRLVCQAFEAFLANRADNPRLSGLIPRSIIHDRALGAAIETKTNTIVAEMQSAPSPAAQQRFYALLCAIEVMFKDPEGVQLARTLRMSRQVPAA